jgi:hypothetical protein
VTFRSLSLNSRFCSTAQIDGRNIYIVDKVEECAFNCLKITVLKFTSYKVTRKVGASTVEYETCLKHKALQTLVIM